VELPLVTHMVMQLLYIIQQSVHSCWALLPLTTLSSLI